MNTCGSSAQHHVLSLCIPVPTSPPAKATAMAQDLRQSFLRGPQEQNKIQDRKLSNKAIPAFPFMHPSHPGEQSCDPVPCQGKRELTICPLHADQ